MLTEQDGFAVRVEQGVLDTNAEALLHANPVGSGNTAEAFKLSQSWVALTRAETDRLDRLGLSADVQRAIAQDLEAGYSVVS